MKRNWIYLYRGLRYKNVNYYYYYGRHSVCRNEDKIHITHHFYHRFDCFELFTKLKQQVGMQNVTTVNCVFICFLVNLLPLKVSIPVFRETTCMYLSHLFHWSPCLSNYIWLECLCTWTHTCRIMLIPSVIVHTIVFPFPSHLCWYNCVMFSFFYLTFLLGWHLTWVPWSCSCLPLWVLYLLFCLNYSF